MTRCELCEQGDPSINARCWNCGARFHLHKSQLDMVGEGFIILGDCPSCGTVNCWVKHEDRICYSGPEIYWGQPMVDLRGKR